jgi:hypothetical protein
LSTLGVFTEVAENARSRYSDARSLLFSQALPGMARQAVALPGRSLVPQSKSTERFQLSIHMNSILRGMSFLRDEKLQELMYTI